MEKKNIHFIGIGGIGTSAIASILAKKNFNVSGSDLKVNDRTSFLRNLGIKIYKGHSSNNIKEEIDLVVYTSAITKDNIEYKEAIKNNITTISRTKMLGKLMNEYEKSFSIAGTHGKTTTTSMVTHIIKNLGLDPTSLIGGKSKNLNNNALIGNSDILITEACEYKENFLDLNQKFGCILNIEADHLDYFKDLNEIKEAFLKFANKIKDTVILNVDDTNIFDIMPSILTKKITIGIDNKADFMAKNIKYINTNTKFDLYYKEKFISNCSLKLLGKHNIYNALTSIALSYCVSDNLKNICKAISSFKGVARRFDIVGRYNDSLIINDYAHHPSEIKTTLEAAKNINKDKIICVFQPHTYSRTKELLNEFSSSFKLADEVIILNIYAAREKNNLGISSKDLVVKIKANHKNVKHFMSLDNCSTYLKKHINKNELVLIMGAGNIINLSKKILA